MFLGGPGQHRILGRLYNDEQLFRIIVPRRFTLRKHHSDALTTAGFSKMAIALNTHKRPEYSDADIVLVLRYRWPDQFAELKVMDIAHIDASVRGGGNHLKSVVDPLEYDDSTLSKYCHEKVYEDATRRGEVLDAFRRELGEARSHRAAAVDEQFKEFEPQILEYIFVARIYMAMSWNKIALSLERRGKKPTGFFGEREDFDGTMVKEIYQVHSEARTCTFDECVNNKDSLQKVLSAMPLKVQQEHERRSKLSSGKPAVLRKVLSVEPLECHLSLTKTELRSKRQRTVPITLDARPMMKAQQRGRDGCTDFQLFD